MITDFPRVPAYGDGSDHRGLLLGLLASADGASSTATSTDPVLRRRSGVWRRGVDRERRRRPVGTVHVRRRVVIRGGVYTANELEHDPPVHARWYRHGWPIVPFAAFEVVLYRRLSSRVVGTAEWCPGAHVRVRGAYRRASPSGAGCWYFDSGLSEHIVGRGWRSFASARRMACIQLALARELCRVLEDK